MKVLANSCADVGFTHEAKCVEKHAVEEWFKHGGQTLLNSHFLEAIPDVNTSFCDLFLYNNL